MDNAGKTNETKIKPKHYADFNPPISRIFLAWNVSFHVGSIMKYILRFKNKNGIEDLLKARTYLDEMIETERILSTRDNNPVSLDEIDG